MIHLNTFLKLVIIISQTRLCRIRELTHLSATTPVRIAIRRNYIIKEGIILRSVLQTGWFIAEIIIKTDLFNCGLISEIPILRTVFHKRMGQITAVNYLSRIALFKMESLKIVEREYTVI